MNTKNIFLAEKNFPDSESYIFKNLIKFPKRFYSIFQKLISGEKIYNAFIDSHCILSQYTFVWNNDTPPYAHCVRFGGMLSRFWCMQRIFVDPPYRWGFNIVDIPICVIVSKRSNTKDDGDTGH